jgi:hypothetical protein
MWGVGMWKVTFFVVVGGGQEVVGVEAGGVQAPVHRHERLELGPQVLQEHRLSAASAPQQVPAYLEHHPRRFALGEAGGVGPPALVQRLLQVFVEGALHGGVAPLALVPVLVVAAVVVPHEARGHGRVHRPRAGRHLRGGDLVGHGRVLGLDGRYHRVAQVQDAPGLLAARPLLGEAHEETVEHASRPTANASPLLAPVAGEGQHQAHAALHEVAVVVLAGVPAVEEAGLLLGHLAGQRADDIGVDAAHLGGLVRGVLGVQHPAQQVEDGAHLDHGAVLESGLESPFQGGVDVAQA